MLSTNTAVLKYSSSKNTLTRFQVGRDAGAGRCHERESDRLQATCGLTKDWYPIKFLGLIGVDIAGTVVKIGPGVEGFSVGDRVFAMADDWESFAIVDGLLVTGQNPASSTSAARAL